MIYWLMIKTKKMIKNIETKNMITTRKERGGAYLTNTFVRLINSLSS